MMVKYSGERPLDYQEIINCLRDPDWNDVEGDDGTLLDDAADALEKSVIIKDILGNDYGLDRLRELVQADREGRCVVLSTPMRPMICKPNDTDVYCPRCGETLSGGWPESDYYDYRKMVQCPNCGESIDDNKCETVERRAI
ncbi:hypothetical protein [Butyricicoccus pullicaecorum]|nr:hypothetical protein [Butyricicoccus pullicaecorum]